MLPGKNYWHRDTVVCKDPKQQQVKEEHKDLVCLEDTDWRWEWEEKNLDVNRGQITLELYRLW